MAVHPLLTNGRGPPVPERLLIDAFQFDEAADTTDDHALLHLQAAGERRLVVPFGLPRRVIPDLAIRTFAVPAEISIRDGSHREILKASKQVVVIRHLDAVA